MTGWCPRHDEIVESNDGLCPQCGAVLVVEEVVSEQPTVFEPERDPTTEGPATPEGAAKHRRGRSVVWIAAAITAAFVAGVAFPDVRTSTPKPARSIEARLDRTVGITRSDAGLEITLASITQTGRHLVARFTVAGETAPGAVESASLEILGGGRGIIGADVMQARATVDGFILEGDIAGDGSELVTGVNLSALGFRYRATGEIPLDLTGVWPATRESEPRARHGQGEIVFKNGFTIHLEGLVGWHDRLEVGVREDDPEGNRTYGVRYSLVTPFDVVDGTATDPSGSRSIVVAFADISRKLRKTILRVVVEDFEMDGSWRWELASIR
ncbi:MAG: hypothetical protein ACRDKS_01480 [Actinomycetota bacterium]